jgi:hypothetical protein
VAIVLTKKPGFTLRQAAVAASHPPAATQDARRHLRPDAGTIMKMKTPIVVIVRAEPNPRRPD